MLRLGRVENRLVEIDIVYLIARPATDNLSLVSDSHFVLYIAPCQIFLESGKDRNAAISCDVLLCLP